MAIAGDKVRVQAVVNKKTAEKIREFAGRMECSESRMIALLLESAVEDNEWVIKVASSNLAKRLAKAFGLRRKAYKDYEPGCAEEAV